MPTVILRSKYLRIDAKNKIIILYLWLLFKIKKERDYSYDLY